MTHVDLNTGRGVYRMALAAPPSMTADEIVLTLSFERSDGLERIGFICTIARTLMRSIAAAEIEADTDAILGRLAPWFERDFERTREGALKSLRSERRPLVVRWDRENPGPFAV